MKDTLQLILHLALVLAVCLLASCAFPGNVAQDPFRVALAQQMVQQQAAFAAQPHIKTSK